MARGKGWRDPAKEQFWRKAVRGWQRSGLSIRAYCGCNELSENNFYAWRREIARRDAHPQRGRSRLGAQRSRRRGSVVADKNLFVPVPVALPRLRFNRDRVVVAADGARGSRL